MISFFALLMANIKHLDLPKLACSTPYDSAIRSSQLQTPITFQEQVGSFYNVLQSCSTAGNLWKSRGWGCLVEIKDYVANRMWKMHISHTENFKIPYKLYLCDVALPWSNGLKFSGELLWPQIYEIPLEHLENNDFCNFHIIVDTHPITGTRRMKAIMQKMDGIWHSVANKRA